MLPFVAEVITLLYFFASTGMGNTASPLWKYFDQLLVIPLKVVSTGV
jgi:hypothetical protein